MIQVRRIEVSFYPWDPIEIFENIRGGQKDEFGHQLPELTFLTAPNILEYFYTKIRFSTPGMGRRAGVASSSRRLGLQ